MELKSDPRDWARRILADSAAGHPVNPAALAMAKAAMAGRTQTPGAL